MTTREALFWIALFLIGLVYLVYRNIKLAKVLRKTQSVILTSQRRCLELTEMIENDTLDKEQREDLFRELNEEIQRMEKVFSDRRAWPEMNKRISDFMRELSSYSARAERALNH